MLILSTGAKRYGLFDINIPIKQGDLIAITRPKGVGKNTLLETLNSLLPHTAGMIRNNGTKPL